MKRKISLIGAGQIGGTLAHIIALKNLGNIVLFDVAEGIAKGKALDIAQSSGVSAFDVSITGTSNYNDIKNSDQWPDNSSFKIDRWHREQSSKNGFHDVKDSFASQFPDQNTKLRPLPRSSRRRN